MFRCVSRRVNHPDVDPRQIVIAFAQSRERKLNRTAFMHHDRCTGCSLDFSCARQVVGVNMRVDNRGNPASQLLGLLDESLDIH